MEWRRKYTKDMKGEEEEGHLLYVDGKKTLSSSLLLLFNFYFSGQSTKAKTYN